MLVLDLFVARGVLVSGFFDVGGIDSTTFFGLNSFWLPKKPTDHKLISKEKDEQSYNISPWELKLKVPLGLGICICIRIIS